MFSLPLRVIALHNYLRIELFDIYPYAFLFMFPPCISKKLRSAFLIIQLTFPQVVQLSINLL